jgi:hypothetical protein
MVRVLEYLPLTNASCHLIAHAFGKAFGLPAIDGWFSDRPYEHSWIVTPHDNIIDLYPIGVIGGPFLLDAVSGPWSSFYRPGADWSTKIDPVEYDKLVKVLGDLAK